MNTIRCHKDKQFNTSQYHQISANKKLYRLVDKMSVAFLEEKFDYNEEHWDTSNESYNN